MIVLIRLFKAMMGIESISVMVCIDCFYYTLLFKIGKMLVVYSKVLDSYMYIYI